MNRILFGGRWKLSALLTFITVCSGAVVVVGQPVEITSNTAASRNLYVEWSANDPERIEVIKWNSAGLSGGEANLTRTGTVGSPPCFNGNVEYFGNSWAPPDPPAGRVLVGAGTTGTREPGPDSKVQIDSISNGCPPVSAGVPVETTYKFWRNGQPINRMKVTREFDLESAFTLNFRPYIPRLYPIGTFSQVIHPDALGTSLVTENALACPFGCLRTNWDGDNADISWYAVHNPIGGNGVIVRRTPSDAAAELWIDWDGASSTNSSSVILLAPDGGFTGNLSETQFLCFYDSSIWIPSLELPPGC